MPSTAICCLRPAAAFAAGMILLGGCAEVGSDGRQSACPPVMEYSRGEQARGRGSGGVARGGRYCRMAGRLYGPARTDKGWQV